MKVSGTGRITRSEHHSWAVKRIIEGATRDDLYAELRQRGFSISKKIVTQFVREVKATQPSKEQRELELRAGTVIDKLKGQIQEQNLSKVIGVIERRGPIIKEVDERINLIKGAQDRDTIAKKLSFSIQSTLNQFEGKEKSESREELLACITEYRSVLVEIDRELRKELPKFGIKADLESVLQRYYKDKHEYYKYLESFIAKYEIKTLLEKTAKAIAQAAIEILLKEIPEEKKILALKNFKESTFAAVKEIAREELDA